MQDLPPAGSTRRRMALGFWIVFTTLFAVLLAYALVAGPDRMPWLAFIGGAGSLIGLWRWIARATAG